MSTAPQETSEHLDEERRTHHRRLKAKAAQTRKRQVAAGKVRRGRAWLELKQATGIRPRP